MARIAKITNTSNNNVKVKLKGGPEITIPAGSSLENVDVENVSDLKGKVSVKDDLTEVVSGKGKTRIDGRRT